ncbi:hypothetical protein [Blastococcus aurantiacus]|nr:hypothetical protein [Blastococcus aurantiacus]
MDSVLEVPEGAELLGAVFPGAQNGWPGSQEETWDAVLVITGEDPVAVLKDLVAQAEESGFALRSFSPESAACGVLHESVLQCQALTVRDDGSGSYEFNLQWGTFQGAGFSHVLVRRQSRAYDVPSGSVSFETDLPPAPPSIDEWEGPEAGEPVAAPTDAFDTGGAVAILEPGGRVVGPPAHSWSLSGGYGVVVALDDGADADQVVAAYAAQFERFGFEGTVTGTTFEGNRAVAARYNGAGAGDLEAVVVEDANSGRSFLRLSRAND